MLDALDQLSAQETAHGLRWLVDYIPERVRLVVSSLEGDCLDVLRRRGVEEIPLPPLVEKEQRQIVQNMLDEWRRKLDERQMATLLAHPCVKSPLYLRVALEELKLFGKYEELTTRIKTLADSIPGLFDQVLARLEEDHGRWLVSEAFGFVAVLALRVKRAGDVGIVTARRGGAVPARTCGHALTALRGLSGTAGSAPQFFPPAVG